MISLNFEHIVGLASVLGAIAAWIALYPQFKPFFLRFIRVTPLLSSDEISYLKSLKKDLESKNNKNFYVEVNSVLQDLPSKIPPKFYVVKSILGHLKDYDFNNLSNVEKIDNSRGRSYNSLSKALNNVQDNAAIVIAPPGGGKTVSLRNLTIKTIHERLDGRSTLTPVFINLGFYNTDYKCEDKKGSMHCFDDFLEEYFSNHGYYTYLSNGKWKELLLHDRCIFFLDGMDELPRSTDEYNKRTEHLRLFISKWPNTQFVLSCRELDYNQQLNFQQILLKPFSRSQIAKYIKRYFNNTSYKVHISDIEDLPEIYKLCHNPFYLNLTCLYITNSSKKDSLPRTKTQLFQSLVDNFMFREERKSPSLKDSAWQRRFLSGISSIAYYAAVKKMSTTISIDEYKAAASGKNIHTIDKTIEYGLRSGLLDLNELGELRFVHHRFQEYFSSLYIFIKSIHNKYVIPNNFFTNIWWRETVLFISHFSGGNPYFMKKIMNEKKQSYGD